MATTPALPGRYSSMVPGLSSPTSVDKAVSSVDSYFAARGTAPSAAADPYADIEVFDPEGAARLRKGKSVPATRGISMGSSGSGGGQSKLKDY